MKIIHFSTFDIEGGAGNAAYQLHRSFKLKGLDSIMLVNYKKCNDPSVFMIGNPLLKNKFVQNLKRNDFTYYIFNKINNLLGEIDKNNLFIKFNKNKTEPFSRIKKHIEHADIVCLHWIDDFLSIETIKKICDHTQAPVVWFLQDIESLTGGCHYTDGCEKFKFSCGKCPQLYSNSENDLSRKNWQRKKNELTNLNITFIAASSWVYNRIKESSLFKNFPVEKILLTLDETIFNQENREEARISMAIPSDAHVIFFGAQNFHEKRKGMHLLKESFDNLYVKMKNECPENLNKILLLSAGRDIIKMNKYFKQTHLGWLRDSQKMANAYKAADVFVCPSTEDAGPIMINQSIACGTPVISFDIGVAADLIQNSNFGYVTKKFDTQKFAENLYKKLFETNSKISLKSYNSSAITNTYIKLFYKLSKKTYE